jgi:photosystem II stability/assembly factor-like uncharacterized protein
MKRLIIIFCTIIFIYSCNKSDDFEFKANDSLIFPNVDLQVSSWEELGTLAGLSFTDISFYNENVGIISGYGGFVYITKDGGDNWKTIETNINMTFLCTCALDEKTFFVARRGLFKSTDEGETWMTCNFSQDMPIYNIRFIDSINGFLSCSGGTYKTNDAGDNWKVVTTEHAYHLQFTSENIGYFASGYTVVPDGEILDTMMSEGYINRTKDGGNSWIKINLNVNEIYAMSFISDKVGYFVTIDACFYRTADGGESCQLIRKFNEPIYNLFFVNENQGLLGSDSDIYITLDGGNSLHKEYTVQNNNHLFWFEFVSPTRSYALGNRGMVLKRL